MRNAGHNTSLLRSLIALVGISNTWRFRTNTSISLLVFYLRFPVSQFFNFYLFPYLFFFSLDSNYNIISCYKFFQSRYNNIVERQIILRIDNVTILTIKLWTYIESSQVIFPVNWIVHLRITVKFIFPLPSSKEIFLDRKCILITRTRVIVGSNYKWKRGREINFYIKILAIFFSWYRFFLTCTILKDWMFHDISIKYK